MRILAGFNGCILQAVNGIAPGEDREITKKLESQNHEAC
jgi:hypothetical protein